MRISLRFLDYVITKTDNYIKNNTKEFRKKNAQFFTSKETAQFMVSLYNIPKHESISILDPGAGTGILSAALLDKLEEYEFIKNIELVCYENDNNVIPLLEDNIKWIVKNSSKAITYTVIKDNYILSQSDLYNNSSKQKKFNLIISNPPYMKIGKNSPEALVLADVCYGTPNLYFLFASMSIFNLEDNGEMVYILPRSWTSGLYFKNFRIKLLKECSLEHIHLFESRNKVFDKEDILQEIIIIKAKKTINQKKQISITTSKNNADFDNINSFKADFSTIINHENYYVYLATNEEDVNILNTLKNLSDTLPSLGLKMKTGVTVDFRHKEELCGIYQENAIPLFYTHHIKRDGEIVFPLGTIKEYIITNQKYLKQKNTNYLFVKRFTAKEEQRRLQCGIYIADKFSQYKEISTDNKVNFICGKDNLTENLLYGLYVIFNSTIYDKYYRILNGSTQVNSSEINSLPVPSQEIIENMGHDVLQNKNFSESGCDKILMSYL